MTTANQTAILNARNLENCFIQEEVQREALKDDEERRQRSEHMRKERAAVRMFT